MKNMANAELKQLLKSNGLYYWQVANELHIAESTLLRWLRTELPMDKKTEIENAVSVLAECQQ